MKTEFEAKVLEVDPVAVSQRILAVDGGRWVAGGMQRRYVYPLQGGKWLRLRDTGSQVTLCVKQIVHDGIDGARELEVPVDDFDGMHELLVAAGHTSFRYQENHRDSFRLGGARVEVDTWPMLPSYVEIEADDTGTVTAVAGLLGFTVDQLTTVNTTEVYLRHGIDIDIIDRLVFDPPHPASALGIAGVTVTKARALAITEAGKLLLIRRHTSGSTHWLLPGGGIEPGDVSVEAAAIRELREETGGCLEIDRLVQVIYTGANARHHAIFLGRITGVDPALRSGPEVDTPDGVYELDEVELTAEAIRPLELWPPAAKTWLLEQLAASVDIFTLPDLRDSGPLAWASIGSHDPAAADLAAVKQ